ncbi:MAG: LPS export ABC transporter permease LptG [Betaproteobacteria bacterium]|nr:LPS export ABC transporter permease LptG [Betaproteobacteria bacterium]
MIFRRTLVRELTATAIGLFVILAAILFTNLVLRLLAQAAGGAVAPDGILALLGFAALVRVNILLAVALFLTVLLTLSRWHRDSEMIVWMTSGQSITALLKPILWFSAPFLVAILALSLFLSPWAEKRKAEFERQLESRDELAFVTPGLFREFRSANLVVFIESINTFDGTIRNVFMHSIDDEKDSTTVARVARLQEGHDGARYVVLEDGRRYEGFAGQPGLPRGRVRAPGPRHPAGDRARDTGIAQGDAHRRAPARGRRRRARRAVLARLGTDPGVRAHAARDPARAHEPPARPDVQPVLRRLHLLQLHELHQHRAEPDRAGQARLLGRAPAASRHGAPRRLRAVPPSALGLRPVPPPAACRPARGPGSGGVRTLTRYIGRDVLVATLAIFVALLSLFAFFDLINELTDVGKGGYTLSAAALYVALHLPSRLYELFPVAALIGTLFALAQLVANSEYTVMRASGASLWQIGWAVVRVGIPLAIATFLAGEFIAPPAERLAQSIRATARGDSSRFVAQQFSSGFWFKQDRTFVNIRTVLADLTLVGVRIYEFDDGMRLTASRAAESGRFSGDGTWELRDVKATELAGDVARVSTVPSWTWTTVLRPSLLTIYQVAPERLEIATLWENIRVLGAGGAAKTSRFEIAFWNKVFYPFAVLAMMVVALPFAHFQRRQGGAGFRIFVGTMLGLAFFLASRLFSSLGVLNDWPPLISATLPLAIFTGLAVGMLGWIERR